MNHEDWPLRQRQQGAVSAAEGAPPLHYGSPEREWTAIQQGVALYLPPTMSFTWMSGEDSLRFANGAFTNKTLGLSPGVSQQTAMADAKGRLQVLMDLWVLEDDRLLLIADGRDHDWVFSKIGLRASLTDVEVEEAECTLFCLLGPQLESTLEAMGWSLPAPGTWLQQGEVRLGYRARCGSAGLDLIVPDELAASIWERLLECSVQPLGEESWHRARILAHQPQWGVDTDERTFVHELKKVEELCSFDKGCYLGQEVINRMERIGKGRTTRQLGRVRAEGSLDLSGGTLRGEDGKALGTIGSSCTHQQHSLGLGMLRNAAWSASLTWERGDQSVPVTIWPPTEG